jgi:hypothetical protein
VATPELPRRELPAAPVRGRGREKIRVRERIASTLHLTPTAVTDVWAGYVYWVVARLRPYLNFTGKLVAVCIILPMSWRGVWSFLDLWMDRIWWLLFIWGTVK